MTWLLLATPLPPLLAYLLHAPALLTFAAGVLAIVPLADLLRRATEEMAARAGSAIGGLLSVTFGNAAELLLALFVLSAGHPDVVKGQLTGSIIGNSLLGLGLAILVGGWTREKQTFRAANAGLLSSLLILAVIALLLPAIFNFTERGRASGATASLMDERLSLGVSVILALLYAANLIYTLVTHRDVFSSGEEGTKPTWAAWLAPAVLLGATAVTALEAEIVSGALEASAGSLGVTPFFLGVTVLAVVGNASEYVTAVHFARQDRMGLVLTVTVGSSVQIALLTAPLLVIASAIMGDPMNLVFTNPVELMAIAGSAFAVNAIARDGETTWFEGLLLIGVYAILAVAFFLVRP